MACSCGTSKKSEPANYQVVKPGGEVVSVRSEVEAINTARRTGGTWRRTT